MATLLKLQINGIRSFGPLEEHIQYLSFDTPVTLLVGQNGCGKTTILEAIKYACTSDIPDGTNKGQGFVHDPKISEMSLIKGQIRLKLIDVKGDTYHIIKSVQVKQSSNKLTFSTLDSSLTIMNTAGEKRQIGGRCVDIDKHIAQVLQISPCILNNVLFCHQENASWPLDEGKKVKEKFDEIFDSKRYNKCGDLLSKTLTAKESTIKLLKYEVETKKSKKDDVSRKKKSLDDKKEQSENLREEILKKIELLEPDKIRLDEIEQLEVDIGRLQKQLVSKQAEQKGLIQQQNMLKENINDIFEGDDEELQVKIMEFEKDQTKKEESIKDLDQKREYTFKKETEMNAEIQKEQIKLGQIREEKKQHELQINRRNILFEKAKASLNVSELTWNTVEESLHAIDKLKLALKEMDENLNSFIKMKNSEETQLQQEIDRARENLATTKERVKTTSTEMKKNDEKILQVINEIQELDIADSQLVKINKKIENLSQTLLKLQSNFDEEATEVEISECKKRVSTMESQLEDLEELYKILQCNYVVEEKLNSEEQTKIQKTTEFNKIMNKHKNNFGLIFNDQLPTTNIGGKVQDILSTNEVQIRKLSTDIAEQQKELTKLEAQIQHLSMYIKKHEEELKTKKSEIESVCKNNDYSTFLQQTLERKEKFQKDKGKFSSAKIMYQTFIDQFEKEKACCPICETDFSGKASLVSVIVNKLKQKIKSLPERLSQVETNLKNEEKLYNKLQQLMPVNASVEEISSVALPLLYEQLQGDKIKLTQIKEQLSSLNEDLTTPTQKVEICKRLLTDATLLDQYRKDINTCEENIENLVNQKQNVNTSKNKHEVESEVENLKGDLNDQRKRAESIRQKLDQHKQRCQKIKEDKSKELELQLKYQTKANNKPLLQKQLEELEDSKSCLLVEREEQQSELSKCEDKLKVLSKNKITLVSNNEKSINNQRSENNKKHKLVEEIIKLDSDISDYKKNNSDGILQEQCDKVRNLQDQRKHLVDEKNEIINKITEIKEEIAKQKTKLRELQDNVLLREKQKSEKNLIVEITNLQNKIGDYNYHSLSEEKIKLKKKIEIGEREINSSKGQEMQLRNNIEDDEKEMNLPDNKNAAKNYREKLYELKLMEKLVLDLKVYIKALHFSVLEYHKDRMVQINRRIRELWRNVYKGNDIDYIEIQTKESNITSNMKKSYDYKVVQNKNGVDLEMRGRCSAGQRVLACLIIRIALAESFSSHCGILALDEPTTNLDKENITSLTYALSNLITSHANDNNFQLIVITHDQDFLDILRHNVQNISHYWRVTRDPRGHSQIKKERL